MSRDMSQNFMLAVLERTGEWSSAKDCYENATGSEGNTNIIRLQKSFGCSIHFLSSKKNSWGLSNNTINRLKQKPPFVIVLLLSPVEGYIVYDTDIEGFIRRFNLNSNGVYSITENKLPSTCRNTFFIGIDTFIDKLRSYQKQ